MRNVKEMLEGLVAMYAESPALFLYPWILASLAWVKSSGSQIPYYIPVVPLYDFSHPNQIPEKDFSYAIDGERYYFTKQVRRDARGNRSKRKAGEQGAFWKSTSRDIDIKDLNGKLIGYMRKYTLCKDKVDKRSANWLMEEYRVHDPDHELVDDDPYVLCKIYHKDSFCPKYTDTSIRALTERIIERQSQTQFDGSDSHEDTNMQPPSENFRPELFLPTSGPPSDNYVCPMLHGSSIEFSMSHDPSGNLNPPELSIPSNSWNSNPMNQSQTQSDNNNSVENFPSDSGNWHPSPSYSYSNDQCRSMMDGISNGPSMPHYFSGNLNAVDGEEPSLDWFPQLWHH